MVGVPKLPPSLKVTPVYSIKTTTEISKEMNLSITQTILLFNGRCWKTKAREKGFLRSSIQDTIIGRSASFLLHPASRRSNTHRATVFKMRSDVRRFLFLRGRSRIGEVTPIAAESRILCAKPPGDMQPSVTFSIRVYLFWIGWRRHGQEELETETGHHRQTHHSHLLWVLCFAWLTFSCFVSLLLVDNNKL